MPAVRVQPWLAVNLSLLWPGMGQCYSGAWGKGLLLGLSFALLLGRGLWSMFAATGSTSAGFWQLGIAAAIFGGSLWDAYRSAEPQQTSGKKDAWYSLFLSQLLPGLGHFYLGQTLLGGLFLLLGVGLAYWANQAAIMLLPLAYSLWAAASYHA
ncbi:MAG: hypothetical protein F6J97_14900, partial [Leptolyngbya sp. SIO4C1]|nr:hypothetical protein [Leptolyngbya sp. SIO4C1]